MVTRNWLHRNNAKHKGMRLAVILFFLIVCPNTLGFESSRWVLKFQHRHLSARAACNAFTSPGCRFHSKRLHYNKHSAPNGASSSSANPVTYLLPSTSTLAWSKDVSAETSTTWDEVLSPQPSSPLASEGTRSHNIQNAVTFYDKVLLASFTGLAVATIVMLLVYSAPGAWRFFLAGGICAATSHSIPTPIDVVKVSVFQLFSLPLLRLVRTGAFYIESPVHISMTPNCFILPC